MKVKTHTQIPKELSLRGDRSNLAFLLRLPRLRAGTCARHTHRKQALQRAGTHLVPLLAGLAMTGWEKSSGFLNLDLN